MEHLDLHLEDISLVVDLVETKHIDLEFLDLLLEVVVLVVAVTAVAVLPKMVEVLAAVVALMVPDQTHIKLVVLVEQVL
jgi:hypothetical protein